MKMEGSFAGDLVSTGDIVVAPTGKIAGDLKGLRFLLIEGQVRRETEHSRNDTLIYGFSFALKVFYGIRHALAGNVFMFFHAIPLSQAVF